jgi:hypothetical protein
MRTGLVVLAIACAAGEASAASTSELLRCQKALHGAGRSFTKAVQTYLTNCALKVETCQLREEIDGEDPTVCLASATTSCQGYSAKVLAADATYEAKIVKVCALVPLGDLEAYVGGLGFFHANASCAATDSTALVGCVFDDARCAAERLVFAADPRAQDALVAAGVAAAHPCVAP